MLALSFLTTMTASAGPWVIRLLIGAWACPCWAGAMGLADCMATPNQGHRLAVVHVLHELQIYVRRSYVNKAAS